MGLWEDDIGYHDLQATVEVMAPNALKQINLALSCFSVRSVGGAEYEIQAEASRCNLRVLDITGRSVKPLAHLSGNYTLSLKAYTCCNYTADNMIPTV